MSNITGAPPWRLGDDYPDDWIDAALLRPSDGNPRRGSIEGIASSIEANGWFGALICQTKSLREGGPRILIGNHRYQAGRMLGMERFPVIWLDVDDEHGDRILVADNRYAELATWDDAALVAMLGDLPDLDGTGFTDADLEALRQTLDLGDIEAPEGGRAAPGDVKIQIGTISFTVTRDQWDAFEGRMLSEVGTRHEDQVAEVRGLLHL